MRYKKSVEGNNILTEDNIALANEVKQLREEQKCMSKNNPELCSEHNTTETDLQEKILDLENRLKEAKFYKRRVLNNNCL